MPFHIFDEFSTLRTLVWFALVYYPIVLVNNALVSRDKVTFGALFLVVTVIGGNVLQQAFVVLTWKKISKFNILVLHCR